MKFRTGVSSALIINLILCLGCLTPDEDVAGPGSGPAKYKFEWNAIADSSVTSLNQNFWNGAKYYNNANPSDNKFGYWPQAHALDVLIDAYTRTKNDGYVTYMNHWFVGVKIKNGDTWLNEYYDDMEWNALAMNRAFRATGDSKWQDAAIELFNDIKGGWNENMGGGIAWNKTRTAYKNTPANAPAAILAARLYIDTKDADYLTWAKKIYDWEKATLVDPTTGIVYDGINNNNDGKVEKSPGWNFAYNQGTYIGAALELYAITQNAVYLQDAIKTANAMLADPNMSPGGIMKPSDNGDGGLFNGIGVRYLTLLILNADVPKTTRDAYVAYLKKNAETLWLKGTERPKVIFNNNWNSLPSSGGYLSTQLSGCMLMEAMALLKSKGHVE